MLYLRPIDMKKLCNAALAVAFMAPLAAYPADGVDPLARCLADSTTGKDRKDLAKWIYVSMSAHPEIRPFGAVPPDRAEGAQKAMAALVTRLMAEDCPGEIRAAVRAGGPRGVESAFEHLGKIAMQELMTNPEVNQSIGAFERFLDQARLEKALKAD